MPAVDDSYTLDIVDGVLDVGSYIAAFDVNPVDPGGFLENDTGITNPDARFVILSTTFALTDITWFDGGSFSIAAGTTPGNYQFTYRILDYDGLGTNSNIGTVNVTVT